MVIQECYTMRRMFLEIYIARGNMFTKEYILIKLAVESLRFFKNRKILKIVRTLDKYLVFFGKHIIDAQYVRQILPNLGYKIIQYSFAEVSKRLNWKGPSS